MADRERVRLLDALCARAWPAFEQEQAAGWILRAAAGVSLRANSVWPRDTLDSATLAERIARAEAFYAARALPPRFQISPAAVPPELERELERRAYRMHTTTDVMVAGGPSPHPPAAWAVELHEHADDRWRGVMLESAADHADARGRLAIAEGIGLPRRHALVALDGEAAAIGLGVVDGAWLGIFAMRTHPRFRRRGLAQSIVAALRDWAASQGAGEAYLQVEADNPGAIALYRGLGFTREYAYRYWTRDRAG